MLDSVQKMLQTAVWNGDLDACKAAFNRGADLSLAFENRMLPMEVAVHEDKIDVFRWMLEMGADVHAKLPVLNGTLLHDVASVEMCQLLLGLGLDVNNRDNTGRTPLHWAATRGNLSICKLLIDHGADVMALADSGATVLQAAVWWGSKNEDGSRVDLCKFFIGLGVTSSFTPSKPEAGYFTAFQYAAKNGYDSLVELFCRECGEDPAQRTIAGRTMQQVAYLHPTTKDLLRRLRMEYAANTGIDRGYEAGVTEAPRRSRGMAPL